MPWSPANNRFLTLSSSGKRADPIADRLREDALSALSTSTYITAPKPIAGLSPMQLHWLDAIIVITYLASMQLMGWYFAKRNTSTEEYFVGGRSFPGWVIGISMVGASISSVTFVAYPADAFKTAWLRYLPNLMLPLAVLIAAYVFLPFFRRGNTITAYEYLEQRFGPSVRAYGAVTFILAQWVRLATILYLLSLLVNAITGIDPVTCVVFTGIFVAIYTVQGGIDAAIWTDMVQTTLLASGGIICLLVIVHLMPGGLAQIIDIANANNKLSLYDMHNGIWRASDWHFTLSDKTASMMLLLGLTTWLTEYSSNQNTVQRYVAAKSMREARIGMLVCVLSSLPIWAFYMFLGTALFAFYQVFPAQAAAEMLDGTRKAEQILPFFIVNELPAGVIGIVVAAALSAAMSTMNAGINSISAVYTVDIYRRHLNRSAGDAQALRAAKIASISASTLSIVGAIALYKASSTTLQDTKTILVSLLGGGLLGLYVLGMFTHRGDARAVWCGIAATLVFTLWTIASTRGWLPDALALPFDAYYTMILANLLMFAVVFVAASTLFRSNREVRHLTVWRPQNHSFPKPEGLDDKIIAP